MISRCCDVVRHESILHRAQETPPADLCAGGPVDFDGMQSVSDCTADARWLQPAHIPTAQCRMMPHDLCGFALCSHTVQIVHALDSLTILAGARKRGKALPDLPSRQRVSGPLPHLIAPFAAHSVHRMPSHANKCCAFWFVLTVAFLERAVMFCFLEFLPQSRVMVANRGSSAQTCRAMGQILKRKRGEGQEQEGEKMRRAAEAWGESS
jgi:hypothetical protein